MNSKHYLLSIKPKYSLAIYILFISLIAIFILMFYFDSYDVYQTRGYISCEDVCKLIISVDIKDTNKLNNIDYLRINKKELVPKNKNISDIKSDDNTKSNYQIVTYEVDKLDDVNNTFIDVKVYSSKEIVINKIKNTLLGGL